MTTRVVAGARLARAASWLVVVAGGVAMAGCQPVAIPTDVFAFIEVRNGCDEPIRVALQGDRGAVESDLPASLLQHVRPGEVSRGAGDIAKPVPEVLYLWAVGESAVRAGEPVPVLADEVTPGASDPDGITSFNVTGDLCP